MVTPSDHSPSNGLPWRVADERESVFVAASPESLGVDLHRVRLDTGLAALSVGRLVGDRELHIEDLGLLRRQGGRLLAEKERQREEAEAKGRGEGHGAKVRSRKGRRECES